jgi:hypothetical protein
MDGNSDVIWGFIDDIWHWYNNKISPHDPGHEKNIAIQKSLSPKE